jgi:hypothetical protein
MREAFREDRLIGDPDLAEEAVDDGAPETSGDED